MSVKQQSVSMPMSSAGIMGFSPDVERGGMQIDPKLFVAVTVGFVIIIKLTGLMF